MSDPRLSLRWGVTGQFGTPLFAACREEYSANQVAGVMSGTMGCKVVDFGEPIASDTNEALLAFAAERADIGARLKAAEEALKQARTEADGLRIALVASECRSAGVREALPGLSGAAAENTCARVYDALTRAKPDLPKGYMFWDGIKKLAAERDAARAEVDRWKSASPTVEGHDVAWWREEERRTARRLQAALDEWNEHGTKNNAKIARLEKEVDDAQKRWSAFRVKASADAHSIVTIANGLRIQG